MSSANASPPPKNRSSRKTLSPRDYLHDPLQVGLTIVGTTAVMGLLGWWLDSKLHTFPILMAIGAAAGLFGIIYQLYLRLQHADKPPEDHNSDLPEN